MSARAHLVRIHPPLEGGRVAVYPFEGARMTLGREGCSIDVQAPGVSKKHARVERPRLGTALRVQDLGARNGTQVGGEHVPSRGMDLPPGAILRLGEALFVHRRFTDEEAAVASLPPLPGPLDTRCPELVATLRRVQGMRGSSGPVWVCGEVGCGRSVALEHLRGLAAEAPKNSWITGGALDFRVVDAPPEGAFEGRVLRIPPLRDRPEDVPLLIERTLGRVPDLWPRLREAFVLHDWPGNTQELRMTLRRCIHPSYAPMPGSPWDVAAFPDVRRSADVRRGKQPPVPAETVADDDPALLEARLELDGLGRDALADVLDAHRWRIFAAAEALGVRRRDVFARMGRVKLRGPDRDDGPEQADAARRRIREMPRAE